MNEDTRLRRKVYPLFYVVANSNCSLNYLEFQIGTAISSADY
jgi:hypothetical protein